MRAFLLLLLLVPVVVWAEPVMLYPKDRFPGSIFDAGEAWLPKKILCNGNLIPLLKADSVRFEPYSDKIVITSWSKQALVSAQYYSDSVITIYSIAGFAIGDSVTIFLVSDEIVTEEQSYPKNFSGTWSVYNSDLQASEFVISSIDYVTLRIVSTSSILFTNRFIGPVELAMIRSSLLHPSPPNDSLPNPEITSTREVMCNEEFKEFSSWMCNSQCDGATPSLACPVLINSTTHDTISPLYSHRVEIPYYCTNVGCIPNVDYCSTYRERMVATGTEYCPSQICTTSYVIGETGLYFAYNRRYPGFCCDTIEVVCLVSISDSLSVGWNLLSWSLQPPRPNPSRGPVKTGFTLTKAQRVWLRVCDVLGRTVATLLDEELAAGEYHPTWDGTGVTAGVYIFHLEVGEVRESKAVVRW